MNIVEFDILNESIVSKYLTFNIDEYLRTRSDIITKPDIFVENQRSVSQTYTRFDLFKFKKDSKYLIFPIPLELFVFHNKENLIIDIIETLCKTYNDKILIFTWNHDNNSSSTLSKIQTQNFKVINYGYTKTKNKNDITVPFYNINTTQYKENKEYYCSFMGSINNSLRSDLVNAILKSKNDLFKFFERDSEINFLKNSSKSIFTLCPRGGPNDGGFSYRFFECMHLNTIPVILSDNLVFPYDDLNWKYLCVRIDEKYIKDLEYIKTILDKIAIDDVLQYIQTHRMRFTLGGVQEEVFANLKDI